MRYALMAVSIGMLGFISPSHAYEGRYCAYQEGFGSFEDCGFATLEQCRAYVVGVGTGCRINARYYYYEEMRPVKRKARRQRS